jgi:membrane-associated phospholipid phosphatase
MAHLRRYVIFALLALGLFGIAAILVDAGTFSEVDAERVRSLHHFAVERPTVLNLVVFVTNLGTGRPLWIVGTTAILLLVIGRHWFRALVWTLGLLAAQPVTPFLKGQFGRPRPAFADIDGLSFPSGHAFGSAVAYGMLALAVLHVFRRHRWRWALAGALWIWIGLVALSRPMLGVHYPSDVLAGMSLGLGWGLFWAALVEWRDLQKHVRNGD